MNIDEAITILSIELEVKRTLGKDNQAGAITLGIEALEAVKASRIYRRSVGLLPSETKTNIPICPKCKVEGKQLVTSKAAMYGIPKEDVLDNPYLAIRQPTGEWFCPQCKAVLH